MLPPPPPVRECPANQWISDKIWAAQGHLTTAIPHWVGHEIKSLLSADCKQHAVNAASTVESHLSNSAVKEAWHNLKGWYRLAEDQPPPACPETIVKQTAKCVEL
jgi:hypothetical protein